MSDMIANNMDLVIAQTALSTLKDVRERLFRLMDRDPVFREATQGKDDADIVQWLIDRYTQTLKPKHYICGKDVHLPVSIGECLYVSNDKPWQAPKVISEQPLTSYFEPKFEKRHFALPLTKGSDDNTISFTQYSLIQMAHTFLRIEYDTLQVEAQGRPGDFYLILKGSPVFNFQEAQDAFKTVGYTLTLEYCLAYMVSSPKTETTYGLLEELPDRMTFMAEPLRPHQLRRWAMHHLFGKGL